jgi:hypothetical protein
VGNVTISLSEVGVRMVWEDIKNIFEFLIYPAMCFKNTYVLLFICSRVSAFCLVV